MAVLREVLWGTAEMLHAPLVAQKSSLGEALPVGGSPASGSTLLVAKHQKGSAKKLIDVQRSRTLPELGPVMSLVACGIL